uniref:Phosphoinositide phospholipase C n=1 Tax=Rhabditophanes sp. KR3021 TaxID=114890 RepID=A0AC35U4T9_9BILA
MKTTPKQSSSNSMASVSMERRSPFTQSTGTSSYQNSSRLSRQSDIDMPKVYLTMEKGTKVCRLSLLKKWEPVYKKLFLCRDSMQLKLEKNDDFSTVCGRSSKPRFFDLQYVKEVHSLDYKLNVIKIMDKWAKDKDIKQFDARKILIISTGQTFVMNHIIFLFETTDVCKIWSQGIHYIMDEYSHISHAMSISRYLYKHFKNLVNPSTQCVSLKNMKPFIQSTLQLKLQSRQMAEFVDEKMSFDHFSLVYNRLVHVRPLFTEKFSQISTDGLSVNFNNMLRFLKEIQRDPMGNERERDLALKYFERYWRDIKMVHETQDIAFTAPEFMDYLFSPENSIFDPYNNYVNHDMTQPLSHYWIASSHNTYLTGDQLKSESSLDAYAMALLMGCRCVELDCWDGQKKADGEFLEIVIYHGYTMTSKLNLRDVLQTIKHYAFINNDYPVILSIEDNCSVQAQRLLAKDIKEVLGDMLLTQPVDKDETELPSPLSMKKKIILKHKKLPKENESISIQASEDDAEQDILSKECVRRGELKLKDNVTNEWSKHIFVLLQDKLCYMKSPNQSDDDNISLGDSISAMDEDEESMSSISGLDVRIEEMHVTEEWFHGKIEREPACARLLQHADKGNGLFLVRESSTFLGDFSLSFLFNGAVHHCRIKTSMVDGEKRFYLLEEKKVDTLYELVSFYTREKLHTPRFRTTLMTPCPQPQPHLNQAWFNNSCNKERAEELLGAIKCDGAYLIRYSSADANVFVLSIKINSRFEHYRLKRDGRIFVVNQMVFENLNQIVEYYSNRPFVRGVFFKYPVNEKSIGEYVDKSALNNNPGCYMDLRDLEREIEVISIRQNVAYESEGLSFPANVIITVYEKDNEMWKGKYDGNIGWFNSNLVREKDDESDSMDDHINYSCIDLNGCSVTISNTEACQNYVFKITQSCINSLWVAEEYILSADSLEELKEWVEDIKLQSETARMRVESIRNTEKNLRIAQDLSNLVVYCQAVPFKANYGKDINFYEMCSFSEAKHDKLIDKGLIQFNTKQLSRVYPQASRLTSTNLNPVPMWNSACHMVALNYQTGDKSMMLNQGKFLANGKCGYILKPQYLLDETFRPDLAETVITSCPVVLSITIIGGRHLTRKDKSKGICSPFVELEVIGLPCDSLVYTTRTITSNGLNPLWEEQFEFNIHCPEMALLRFLVEDGDFVGPKADPFIGQAVFPVDCLRMGYRSVPLLNNHSEKLELASLLVFMEMRQKGGLSTTIHNISSVLQANRLTKKSRKTSSVTDKPYLLLPTDQPTLNNHVAKNGRRYQFTVCKYVFRPLQLCVQLSKCTITKYKYQIRFR